MTKEIGRLGQKEHCGKPVRKKRARKIGSPIAAALTEKTLRRMNRRRLIAFSASLADADPPRSVKATRERLGLSAMVVMEVVRRLGISTKAVA